MQLSVNTLLLRCCWPACHAMNARANGVCVCNGYVSKKLQKATEHKFFQAIFQLHRSGTAQYMWTWRIYYTYIYISTPSTLCFNIGHSAIVQ